MAIEVQGLRPLDPQGFGTYSVAASSGNIAATLAANSTLFSFRWADATRLCLVESVSVGLVVATAITTSVLCDLELRMARSFTASDSGGTALTLTGNNAKYQTSTMGTTLVTDVRIADTAGLSVGTRTLDANATSRIKSSTGTFAGTVIFPITSVFSPVRRPIVLEQNEGLVIRNPLAGPADGTLALVVNMTWTERLSY